MKLFSIFSVKLLRNYKNINCLVLLVFLSYSFWPSFAKAANFTATINTEHITINQAIKLTLLLTDANAKEAPDLTELNEYFITRGIQQFQNYSSINGKTLKTNGWQVMLQPKMSGELIIPIITINTNHGVLSTQAITLYVDNQNSQNNLPITIEGIVNKTEVFVQEPFIYTLRIMLSGMLANPQLDKLEIANCFVEKLTEEKQQQKIINGKAVDITEIQYLVTPLTAGIITISPLTLRGEIAIPQAYSSKNIDPFAHIHLFGNFANMHEYEPFAIQTSKQELTVKAPIFAVKPWLPLHDLKITENFENIATPKVGEPIIRTISLSAIGAAGEQLPAISNLQGQITGIKIYSEEPKFTRFLAAKDNQLHGKRLERFTLIPTKAGTITIPAITISWWNLTTNEKVITTLPEKVITVAAPTENEETTPNIAEATTAIENVSPTPNAISQQLKILYWIIASLVTILIALLIGIWLYFVKKRHKITPKNIPVASDALNLVTNITMLQEYISNYGIKHWHLPENIAIKEIPEQLSKQGYAFNKDLAVALFNNLDKGLYGQGKYQLSELKTKWQIFSKDVRSIKNTSSNLPIPNKLNPT